MVDHPDYVPVWAAFVGGLLAIGGNVVLQFITENIKESRARQKEYTDKLGEALNISSHMNDWATDLGLKILDSAIYTLENPCHSHRLMGIATIYVPDLYLVACALSQSETELFLAALAWKKAVLARQPTTVEEAAYHNKYRALFIGYWSLYGRARFLIKKNGLSTLTLLWYWVVRKLRCNYNHHRYEYLALIGENSDTSLFVCVRCGDEYQKKREQA